MKNFTLTLFLLLIISCNQVKNNQITEKDFDRAVSFLQKNLMNKTVFNLNINPNWFPDSSGLWYIHHEPGKKKYLKISLPTYEKSDLFDHEQLADGLSEVLDSEVNAYDLPIDRIHYESEKTLEIRVKNKEFLLNTETYELEVLEEESDSNWNEISSPDDKWKAFSKDYNLYLKSANGQRIKQLSTTGKKNYEYGSWYGWGDIMEGENGDRPFRFGVNWSSDSEWIAANICDLRNAEKMFLLDWSIDSLYRPKLLSYYRGSPGDTTMVYMEPVFFNVQSGKEIKPDLPKATHINNIDVEWTNIPGEVLLVNMSRGYQNLYIHKFDLNTEEKELVYTESSETNIDNFEYELLKKSNQLFFLSEKSGWRQLYKLNLDTKEETLLTEGGFYINSIKYIDEEAGKIYFMASGREAELNPYYEQLYSVGFDGKDLQRLTGEDVHHLISISKDGNYFVDNYSTVNIPTKTVLRSAENGEIMATLGEANTSSLKHWSAPEVFTATARDGKTTLYGAFWKPTNFDPNKRYPIVEYSYTGPHTQVFPKDYTRALRHQALAELGFVVVTVDGLGSSGRSKKFHNYSYKNLGGNLEDHVLAIKQLGKKYKWMDTDRVGIFGHSAGGYDAGHALLAYPDFYKVAVASSADHDHRMEKAWWPEMYMGWPVDEAYHEQSNITMAGNLKGKLLITHGGIDENVNPSASFKLAEALIKADKQFDMLILPSQRHGYRGTHNDYFVKTRWNYFVEHLHGAEPIWDFDWE